VIVISQIAFGVALCAIIGFLFEPLASISPLLAVVSVVAGLVLQYRFFLWCANRFDRRP
jgi:hypothetical protein